MFITIIRPINFYMMCTFWFLYRSRYEQNLKINAKFQLLLLILGP